MEISKNFFANIMFVLVIAVLAFSIGSFYLINEVKYEGRLVQSLSDSDKNFIINVALQAPTYSDWCIMNGGSWMPTNQKETYLPITKQEAGQLMQQGKEPIQDSNGNYYATIVTIERVCGVLQ